MLNNGQVSKNMAVKKQIDGKQSIYYIYCNDVIFALGRITSITNLLGEALR